jgi:hypothetical protein
MKQSCFRKQSTETEAETGAETIRSILKKRHFESSRGRIIYIYIYIYIIEYKYILYIFICVFYVY